MKKIFAFVLALLLLLASSVSVAETNLYPMLLLPDYLYYAEAFGVTDLSYEYSFTEISKNTTMMSIDDLSANYNTNTLAGTFIILMYGFVEDADINADLRALGLFAAIEYGDTMHMKTNEARTAVLPILTAMKNTIKDKYDLISKGTYVPFYISANAVYEIAKVMEGDGKDVLAIIIE